MNSYQFSKNHYIDFLTLAQAKRYSFVKASEVKMARNPFILLRHDLDLDLDCALKMAELEAELGIHSSYFILLYNNFYNPFSPINRVKIKKIRELGHEIGLHWDSRDYDKNYKKILRRNLSLLGDIVGEKIISGSQHEPVATNVLNVNSIIKNEVYRDNKNLVYISDSSMRWRDKTPEEVIKEEISMHLLIHPFWWIMKGKTMKEKFMNFEKTRKKTDQILVSGYYKNTVAFLKKRKELDLLHEKKLTV